MIILMPWNWYEHHFIKVLSSCWEDSSHTITLISGNVLIAIFSEGCSSVMVSIDSC